MMAIHPAQIAPINRAFTPDEPSLARARAILATFAARPSAGAVSMDGQMLDVPHLRQAEKLLARAAACAQKLNR
jgi:citrate lyase subunit beta / citryl-CoA lyase